MFAPTENQAVQAAKGRLKKNRGNDVHLRQLAKKSTYVPPFFFFFNCVFGRFSIRGTQKRDKKNHDIARASKPIPGRIKYVRTLGGGGGLSPLEAAYALFHVKRAAQTGKFNSQNVLDIAVENALELLRGHSFKN
jgi:hypothetical protein